MCLYTRYVDNPRYKANKKNGGVIPAIPDIRVKYVPLGCDNCIECRKKKARDWQIRLQEDIKQHKNGKFITLTFSDEYIAELAREIKLTGYDLDNAIATLGVRKFANRWRKMTGKEPRHWLITELGHEGTENIHLHGIIWTDETYKTIASKWKHGHIWPTNENQKTWVNAQTVNYCIKYVSKMDEDHKLYKPKVLCSKGIGAYYTQRTDWLKNKYKEEGTDETYRTNTGHKITMPIYWRNKIYNETEKEKLWLEKLNKEVRYVGGEKIDISKDLKEYYKTLEWYRRINKTLGYGEYEKKDEQYYQRREYENTQRQIMIETRINKAKRLAAGKLNMGTD